MTAAATRRRPGPTASRRPLVIGYGNPLRTDDAVGWLVAAALLDDSRAADLDVIAAHQLHLEYAVEMAMARRVVLVDADSGTAPPLRPGRWLVRRLDDTRRLVPPPRPVTWTHHCTPAALAALTAGLYGGVAPVYSVGVGVASLEPGEHPTEAVADAVPALVHLVVELAHGGRRA